MLGRRTSPLEDRIDNGGGSLNRFRQLNHDIGSYKEIYNILPYFIRIFIEVGE